MKKLLKINYLSEIDEFLARFDKTYTEKSATQQKEIKLSRDLALRRDPKPL